MAREANNSISHTLDASFSYLTRSEGTIVLKPPPALNLSKKTDLEDEICVFGAEKYFSMKLEDDTHRSPRILVDYNYRSRAQQHQTNTSRPRTPSTCSEASWKSQITSLPSRRRSQSQTKNKKVNRKKLFSSFSCNGSCSNQKSIHVHEVNTERPAKDFRKQSFETDHSNPVKQTQPRIESKKHELFHRYARSNKTPSSAFANFGAKEARKSERKEEEEEPRKSLEVFGSEMINGGGDIMAINLERRLSLLSWDAIPKAQSLSISQMVDEDMDSDASSDLFEIENLPGTTKTGQPLIFTKQTSDAISSQAVSAAASSDYNGKKLVAANGGTPCKI